MKYETKALVTEASQIKNFIEKNKKIPKAATLTTGETLSPYSIAYLLSLAVKDNLKTKSYDLVNVIIYNPANKHVDTINNKDVSKKDYMIMIDNFLKFCRKYHRVPRYITVPSHVKVSFELYLYAISKIIVFLDKNKAVPEIPEPVTPITIPGHKPVYQVSIKDFKYKKWTKEQLSEQVCSIADNIDVFDLESIKDIDNSSFSASQIVFHFKGSKEDIISLLKSISAMEKDNIFIKSLNVMYIDEIEYVSYELDITIVNPYYMESSDITEETAADYILSHYGSTDWISATAAGIDLYKDINNVTDTSMYIQQNEETGLPDFIVSIHERFDNMEDIKEYRNSFEKNDTFALGDEFNYEKVINTEDESKILYDTITTLRSDKFLK